MSLLSFLGGVDSNPYDFGRTIGDRQYTQANKYRDIAASYRNGQQGKQLYQTNQRGANTLLQMSLNNVTKDLASKGVFSSALNKQNAMEMQGQAQDKLFGANLDSWDKIQNIGLGYEGLGSQYENFGNQNYAQYGQGKQWAGEQKNSFLNQLIGLAGSSTGGNIFGGDVLGRIGNLGQATSNIFGGANILDTIGAFF